MNPRKFSDIYHCIYKLILFILKISKFVFTFTTTTNKKLNSKTTTKTVSFQVLIFTRKKQNPLNGTRNNIGMVNVK